VEDSQNIEEKKNNRKKEVYRSEEVMVGVE
jgi:hypothetical protein